MSQEQEQEIQAPQKRSQRALLRRQKGWKGFVHGYPKRRRIFDKIWHTIRWGKDGEDSGAKEIERDPARGKTIYKY